MTKIYLKKVYLINWYGFVDKTIQLGKNLSLITGENECGKSTVLDAIKYAFTGDTSFNKATSATRIGNGKRNLSSYTRCLIDPDTKKYGRPASTHPNVYTHISLEYHNELYDTDFVLGVILETNSSDSVDSYWYSMDNTTLEDILFFKEKDKKRYVLGSKQFREINRVELLNKTNALVKFMTMVGLKLQGEGFLKYQRKLRSIMTYNPEAKIEQFIKESVLEDKNINLIKLKQAKESIDDITKSFEIVEKEINDLDEILKGFNDYVRLNYTLRKDDAKRIYKDLLNTNKKINENNKTIENNTYEIRRLKDILKNDEIEKEQKQDELTSAKIQYERMDGARSVKDEQSNLSRLEEKSSEYKEKIKALDELSRNINEYVDNLSVEFSLSNLLDANISSLVKNNELNEFKNKVDKIFEELNKESFELQNKLNEVRKQIDEFDKIIRDCDKNLPDYSKAKDQKALIKEINNKFRELHINSKASFSSSFVVALKDEEWRNSIETFLGVHRYSILVEPEYFHIANEVMDNSQYKYVELVNTKLLENRVINIVDDSLFYQIEIKKEIAKKYFAYWLGNIHAVDIVDVPNYERSISKEGKISRNMSVSFLNFNKLDSFCLGEDSVKLNKERAIKNKKLLEDEEKELLEKSNVNNRKLDFTKSINKIIYKEYDLEAAKNYALNQIEIHECKERIRKLTEALEQNNEYLLLVERIDDINNKLNQLLESIEKNKNSEFKLEAENKALIGENNSLCIKKDDLDDKLNNLFIEYQKEVQEAKDEYNLFVEGKKENGDIMAQSTRERLEIEKSSCERNITNRQSVYNTGKRTEEALPVGLEYESIYRRRKNRLQVDNFEVLKEKLAIQTRKYEGIFKNEFVLKIKTNIEEAQADIKEINKQLKKLKFSTTYQFDVKLESGTSDYARIIDYADYLKKTNRIDDGQIMFTSLVGYDDNDAEKKEEEIKEIINRVISKDNNDLLNNFADYRNYMQFEVIVNNEEINNGRLSKLAGYNSGAGTQIPYTIILSAALSIIYNARQNSTRLVFIDEPFEKMSDKNIKIMLDFFKSQDFQVIFCAPPNKLDSIGKECDAIIPIKKINKSNMTLGAIKLYESV